MSGADIGLAAGRRSSWTISFSSIAPFRAGYAPARAGGFNMQLRRTERALYCCDRWMRRRCGEDRYRVAYALAMDDVCGVRY
eukprot:1629170-Rhodomonas_salina.1